MANATLSWGKKTGDGAILFCNGIPVAEVSVSGSYGYGINYLDRYDSGKSSSRFCYAKIETAVRVVERRFKVTIT